MNFLLNLFLIDHFIDLLISFDLQFLAKTQTKRAFCLYVPSKSILTQDAPQSPLPRFWKAGTHRNVILGVTLELVTNNQLLFSSHNLPRTKQNT